MGSAGQLYGTTAGGGTSGDGTVFELVPPASSAATWTEAVIYAFQGGTDGASPNGVVLGEAPAGGPALYGSTSSGGNQYPCGRAHHGCGTAFMLTPPSGASPQWTETVLAGFPEAVGFYPAGTLALGPAGVLFGVTSGARNFGYTVYALIPPPSSGGSWTKQLIYNFACCGPTGPSNILFRGASLYRPWHGVGLGPPAPRVNLDS